MGKYIDVDKLATIIEERKVQQDQWVNSYHDPINQGISHELTEILSIITSLQQEQPEVDLEHIKNDAELIANKIMIGVQSNRYHTCVYNTERNDFNHSHLVQAARKGIELGLKARKED